MFFKLYVSTALIQMPMVLLTVRALPKVCSDAFSATMPGKAKEILPTLQAPYTF